MAESSVVSACRTWRSRKERQTECTHRSCLYELAYTRPKDLRWSIIFAFLCISLLCLCIKGQSHSLLCSSVPCQPGFVFILSFIPIFWIAPSLFIQTRHRRLLQHVDIISLHLPGHWCRCSAGCSDPLAGRCPSHEMPFELEQHLQPFATRRLEFRWILGWTSPQLLRLYLP